MSPKLFVPALLVALTLMPLSGCVVRVPGTVGAPAPRVYATSWVEQLKLQITPPTPGPRVAAAGVHTWHRVRLQVGRVDDAMPVLSRTLDPYEDSLGDLAAEGFAPGEGYWVRVSLMHVGAGGLEWEVGSGMLGGQGQSVRFQPGPNAVPIPIRPTVAGAQLDASPTPLRRPSRTRSSVSASGVITIGTSGSTGTIHVEEDDDDEDIDLGPLLDWLGEGDSDDEDGYDDSDSDDDSGSDEPETDEGNMGDWLGASAAFKAPSSRTR